MGERGRRCRVGEATACLLRLLEGGEREREYASADACRGI